MQVLELFQCPSFYEIVLPINEPEKNIRGAKMKEMHRYSTFKNSFLLKYTYYYYE
jgi:hypothetical protein